jgi:hypothetical protein
VTGKHFEYHIGAFKLHVMSGQCLLEKTGCPTHRSGARRFSRAWLVALELCADFYNPRMIAGVGREPYPQRVRPPVLPPPFNRFTDLRGRMLLQRAVELECICKDSYYVQLSSRFEALEGRLIGRVSSGYVCGNAFCVTALVYARLDWTGRLQAQSKLGVI